MKREIVSCQHRKTGTEENPVPVSFIIHFIMLNSFWDNIAKIIRDKKLSRLLLRKLI